MYGALGKTVWCLDQMVTCYFFENFMFVGDLLKLFMTPILADINDFQCIKILCAFFPYYVDLSESSFAYQL